MVKVRMNTADVAAEVKCLRKLIGMRCANVYDLSAKTYVFKFMKSSGVTESGESEKVLLLVESGIRLHTTEFARDKSSTPSGFTLKLRKHIRTKRLEEVRQLGVDRVVDFQFGLGEGAHHIILELYAQGNLLLTDAEYNVLVLLRTHRDEEKGLTMMTRHQYPVNSCRFWERTSLEKLEMGLITPKTFETSALREESTEKQNIASDTCLNGQAARKGDAKGKENQTQINAGKKVDGGVKGDKGNLKTILGEILGYGPALSEHIILDAGLPPNLKVFSQNEKGNIVSILTKEQMEVLSAAVIRFEDWLNDIISGERIPEGYIVMQKKGAGKRQTSSPEQEQSKIYDEFSPLMLNQYGDREFTKMTTFDAALDEFFSKIEGQRVEQQRKTQEESAFQKLDKIRKDQESRVEVLKKEVDQSVRMAELIEYNLDDVDAAILAVRTALATGMDWTDLARMIKEERKAGNPVAGLICSVQLEKNRIILLLSNNLDNMDEEEKTRPVDKVEVDLALSAHGNARRWFEMKKKQATKQEKTVAAHEKAFKAAEKKTQQQLAQEKSIAAISHLRKVHWFEKFNWFISSENYLVISGRDAQQNELVVKRYLKKGDLYVHADLHGASSTVIKNHDPNSSVPPLTLNQAGSFTVCRSQAWDSKIVTSAWWVYAHQVSKTAPTGEYLTAGSFMIRGKKNFLPPQPLVMGFGILFRLDESCLAAHLNERKVRVEGEDDVESQGTYDEVPVDVEAASPDSLETSKVALNLVGNFATSSPPATQLSTSSLLATQAESKGAFDNEDVLSGSSDREEETLKILDGSGSVGVELKMAGQSEDTAEKHNGGLDSGKMKSQDSENFDELMDKALELSTNLFLDKPGRKYGLDVYPQTAATDRFDEDVDSETIFGKVMQRDRPYLSKSERRKIKKCLKEDADSEKEKNTLFKTMNSTHTDTVKGAEPNKADESNKEATTSGREQNSVGITTAGKISRGRKGKLKKIKERYAEQDDEERELRMALLASAGRHVVDVTSKKDQGAVEKPIKVDSPGSFKVGGSKVCYKCKRSGHVARDCPVAIPDTKGPESEGSLETNDENVVVKADEMEKMALMAEENILELGDDEREKLTELDSLTGIPLADDVLLYAVPVCGPYNALQGYKYRVKLTPGSSKRGKAAKTAVNVFMHTQEAALREKELMKAITDPELVAAIIGNVKVVAPGLTQLKHRQKKGKKAAISDE